MFHLHHGLSKNNFHIWPHLYHLWKQKIINADKLDVRQQVIKNRNNTCFNLVTSVTTLILVILWIHLMLIKEIEWVWNKTGTFFIFSSDVSSLFFRNSSLIFNRAAVWRQLTHIQWLTRCVLVNMQHTKTLQAAVLLKKKIQYFTAEGFVVIFKYSQPCSVKVFKHTKDLHGHRQSGN